MKTKGFDLDDYIEVWNAQCLSAAMPKVPLEERLKRRFPYRKRYGKMIFQEVFGAIGSFILLLFFISRFYLFQSEEAPFISLVGTIFIFAIGLIDCIVMLFYIFKASSYEVAIIDAINNQMKLLKMERLEILIALTFLIPSIILLLLPSIYWIQDGIDVYKNTETFIEVVMLGNLIEIIAAIILSLYIYKKRVCYINKCIAELKAAIIN